MHFFCPLIFLTALLSLTSAARTRTSLNQSWRFQRFTTSPDSLSYSTLKPWILPSSNNFLSSTSSKHQRPAGTAPGGNVSFVQAGFDDGAWESVDLPHDWAIKGPFGAPGISGGMGKLPSNGVGWYRRNVSMPSGSESKSIFLDIDGAMSYASVWLNGNLVGGWPYGYVSFRLDLTPYMKSGDNNILAIRVDNALKSSRWYPGAGLYRNIWLVSVDTTHVAQYGTHITTPTVSAHSATVNLIVDVQNKGNFSRAVDVKTDVYILDPSTGQTVGDIIAFFPSATANIASSTVASINGSLTIINPQLWGPPPSQTPNMYIAITTISDSTSQTIIDTYTTNFGIRFITYDSNKGILVNNKHVRVQGTNLHHDLGSLGSAFHIRAAERQLLMLQEMGSNALRTSHNPPAPEMLSLTDQLGFVVLDEIFDTWNSAKTDNDYHLIFADWKEADLRSFVRRDRNHPSVIAWSFGNEVAEQSSSTAAATGQPLHDIIKEEDPTRPSTASINAASAGSSFANVMDIESLNYQGEGRGTSTSSSFPSFHNSYPDKMIWTSESASALSSRGTYIFPVTTSNSATVSDSSGGGGNSTSLQVSAYELYAPSWGSSPDKVFAAQDKYPYVAGEFVWTGFDYIGEPTPYDSSARSSYFGIIDLAGFKKDRFYLYQARWRSELKMAWILPHWNWEEREGLVTPVHVFSAADEAELFVNGKSVGRKERADGSTYRFRWDNVTYSAGEVKVVTYMNGSVWATDTKRTVGAATKLDMTADRSTIAGDGYDLSFITVKVVDGNGDLVPRAGNEVTFSVVEGKGRVVATDNGDPSDMTAFPSLTRKAFSGMALAIVKFESGTGAGGEIVVQATAKGLVGAKVTVLAG